MYSRSLRTVGDVCWQCRLRMRHLRPNARPMPPRSAVLSTRVAQPPRRAFHDATRVRLLLHPAKTTSNTSQRSQLAVASSSTGPTFDPGLIPRPPPSQLRLREHLVQWQELYGGPTEETLAAFDKHPAHAEVHNGISKLSSASKADDGANTQQWSADPEDDGEDLITIGLFLKPGDVVELTRLGREPVLAVFVQQLDSESQFFSVNGRWCHSNVANVAFAITRCINPAVLQPLISFLPTTSGRANSKGEIHVPSELATPIQRILERMTEEAEQIYRTNAPVLDTAYAVLADSKRTRMMTLTQIAKILLAKDVPAWKPSPASLLAVRKALHHNEFRFRSDIRSHRLTNVFAIRPNNDVQTVETVHEWIRDHREFLAASAQDAGGASPKPSKGAIHVLEFLKKAQRLVAVCRKDRNPHMGTVGPNKNAPSSNTKDSGLRVVSGEPFTSSEKQIINFLQAWVLTGQFIGVGSLHTACVNLIMSTGCYGKGTLHHTGMTEAESSEINRDTGLTFLQEIGVIMPFENRALYDEQLMLPTVRLSRNLELLNTKAELIRKNPDFRDSMAHLRRDWGSTTVYCIDPVGAQEIDDGVSIERVNGNTSEFWIHVHVANPTAFFDKTHTLSGLAAHMTETVYTPERTYPMLPLWATQTYFSLQSNRPVLTFSSRIDTSGTVLETKIQPGTVRNVISITPSEVSSLLGHDATHETRTIVVGGEVPVDEPRQKPAVTAAERQDLEDLYTATQALWTVRRKAGGVRINSAENQVRVFESPGQAGITWSPPSNDRSRLIQGDPIIVVTNSVPKDLINFGVSPANIVEEMMMLACTTAASWCTERNIPVMYRGTIDLPHTNAMSSDELRDKYVLPYYEEHGKVPNQLALQYRSSLGRAIAHSAPRPHKIIGVSGYVKVTSPLRRFSDMIAHWQIEAAIRDEARTGTKFDAIKDAAGRSGVLPFTQRQIQESIVTLSPREKIISVTKRSSVRFWSMLALLRAFYYNEAPLPDVFRFWVRTVPEESSSPLRGAMGYLPDYGYSALLVGEPTVGLGDEWEVRLERIDIFQRIIYVKPVRLLRQAESEM
jgi:hypothetical protein